jgi:hypothetical protein
MDASRENEVTIYAWAQFVTVDQDVESALKDLMQEAEKNDFKTQSIRMSTELPVPAATLSPSPDKSRMLMRATTEIFPVLNAEPFQLELFGDASIISLPAVKGACSNHNRRFLRTFLIVLVQICTPLGLLRRLCALKLDVPCSKHFQVSIWDSSVGSTARSSL